MKIDEYKLNLYCTCLLCKKRHTVNDDAPAHSCEAYSKKNGIPLDIWNGKNSKCEYFEEKHPIQ